MHLRPPPLPIAELYIDESSQTQNRFLVLGGIIIQAEHSRILEAQVACLKGNAGIRAEMKWGRVSKHHYESYKALLDLFFSPREIEAPFDFHSLVVDTTLIDDRRFNLGDRDLGFNKEIYQLLLKFARLYGKYNFNAYLDHRNSAQPVSETRLIVNRGIMRSNPRRDWPVRRLHMRNSKTTLPLQIVDVLMGALAYRLNGHDTADGASDAKRALSVYALNRAGIQNAFKDTSRAGKFTIWHRRLLR